MSMALLGDQIDIHCGGVDNIFPHHEAEIAQSEGVTGKKFVRYWLHCAHLLVDGQKMAKSLGNFYTVPDVLAKGYTGRELRYALLRVHYRVPLNFTWEGMNEARESLARIDEWLARLREVASRETSNAQRPIGATPNPTSLLKTRSMTISTFLLRSVFYSNPFVKPIARWIKTKWTRLRQVHGWTGGNGSTPFLILKLRLTSPFRTKWHSWQKNARTHGAKRIGNGATNCASGSLRSAGKCATRKTGQSSRAALDPRSTFCVHCSSNV